MKRVNKTGYKYVFEIRQHGGGIKYQAKLNHQAWGGLFDDARTAALSIDRALIKMGKDPVNILRKV